MYVCMYVCMYVGRYGTARYCSSGDGRMLLGYHWNLLLLHVSFFLLSFVFLSHNAWVVGAPKPWTCNLSRRRKAPKSNSCCLAAGLDWQRLGEGNSIIKHAADSTYTISIYSMSRGYKVVHT